MADVQAYSGQSLAQDGFLDGKAKAIVSSQKASGLAVGLNAVSGDEQGNYLLVSPYTEKDHLLDLRSLDAENALLARALTRMKNLRPDYATAPYLQTFNWEEIMDELKKLARDAGHAWKETSFYIVAFRSQIPPTTVYAELGALDKAAHAEATASGGFLKYADPADQRVSNGNVPLTCAPDTGSEPLIRTARTWPPVSGDHSRTQGRVELGQHIARPQGRLATFTPTGESTDIALSSGMICRAGKSLNGPTRLGGLQELPGGRRQCACQPASLPQAATPERRRGEGLGGMVDE